MKNEKKLTPINADLVRELKLQGRIDDANALIQAHHQHLKKQQKIDFSYIRRQQQAIKRNNAKRKGLCTNCGIRLPFKGKIHCQKCIISTNKSNKKRFKRLKKEGLCTDCGKTKIYKHRSNIRCESCLERQKLTDRKYNARQNELYKIRKYNKK